eukprot:TRINITY_DN433_c0_g2_i1.p1 TRINITY_DN433_c0_g2~~TRINITY_DN433_c0_g2_i1.p1  ORF type:complete len:761 (-),score=161.50 TRINITY_DN433_c0_g2_i1:186-2468(-)
MAGRHHHAAHGRRTRSRSPDALDRAFVAAARSLRRLARQCHCVQVFREDFRNAGANVRKARDAVVWRCGHPLHHCELGGDKGKSSDNAIFTCPAVNLVSPCSYCGLPTRTASTDSHGSWHEERRSPRRRGIDSGICEGPAALRRKLAKYVILAASARRRGNRALWRACKLGDLRLARHAFEAPRAADANARAPMDFSATDADSVGFTPLMVACRVAASMDDTSGTCEGAQGIVELLLARRAAPDAAAQDGTRALHISSAGGCLPCVKLLASAKANLSACDGRGQSALSLASRSGFVHVVLWTLRACHDTAPTSSDVGATFSEAPDVAVIFKEDLNGWTALHHAAAAGHGAVSRCLIAAQSKSILRRSTEATTQASHRPSILQVALEAGHLEVFALLLRAEVQKCEPEMMALASSTLAAPGAVSSAASLRWLRLRFGDGDVRQDTQELLNARSLAEHAARGDLEGCTACLAAVRRGAPRGGASARAMAVAAGELLHLEDGLTPLLRATESLGSPRSSSSCVAIVDLLLRARATVPGPPDDRGRTVLHRCAASPTQESTLVLRRLLEELSCSASGEAQRSGGTTAALAAVDVEGSSALALAAECSVPSRVASEKLEMIQAATDAAVKPAAAKPEAAVLVAPSARKAVPAPCACGSTAATTRTALPTLLQTLHLHARASPALAPSLGVDDVAVPAAAAAAPAAAIAAAPRQMLLPLARRTAKGAAAPRGGNAATEAAQDVDPWLADDGSPPHPVLRTSAAGLS